MDSTPGRRRGRRKGILACLAGAALVVAGWLLIHAPVTPPDRMGVLALEDEDGENAVQIQELRRSLRDSAPLFGGAVKISARATLSGAPFSPNEGDSLAGKFNAALVVRPPDHASTTWTLTLRLPPPVGSIPRPDLQRLAPRMIYPRWTQASNSAAAPDLALKLIRAHLALASGRSPAVRGLFLSSTNPFTPAPAGAEADFAAGSLALAATLTGGIDPPLLDFAIDRLTLAKEAYGARKGSSESARSNALNLASALILRARPSSAGGGDIARALILLEPLRIPEKEWAANPKAPVANFLLASARVLERGRPDAPRDPASLAPPLLNGLDKIWDAGTQPYAWASVRLLRAQAIDKKFGATKSEMESAIQDAQDALSVMTRDPYPTEWAAVHSLLGGLYANRNVGDRQENLREAQAHFSAALEVWSPDATPEPWARDTAGRAAVLLQIADDSRGALARQALDGCRKALETIPRESAPQAWAYIHDVAGVACRRLADRQDETLLREAIDHFKSALEVRAPDLFPLESAKTLANLGNAYRDYPGPIRVHMLGQALQAYDAALQSLEYGRDRRISLEIENLRSKAERELQALTAAQSAPASQPAP